MSYNHPAAQTSTDAREERDSLTRAVNRLLEDRGVRFGGTEGHPFRADPVPRTVRREEWDVLAVGLAQRVRALEAFLDDVYTERASIQEGVVPEHVVTACPYVETDLVGLRPVGGARISVAGLDVVRDGQGTFRVLEDNVRTPSGMAYAIAVSEAVSEVLGHDEAGSDLMGEVPTALRHCLESACPHVDGELVLLTDGPSNSAFYEHQWLADAAGLPLATLDDLRRRGDRLELVDGRRVRSVYRRTEEDRIRDSKGELTPVAELLLDPLRAGEVGLVNWFGNGLADDKSVYAHVPELIRHFLGEDPLIASVPTYDLTDSTTRAEVLGRLGEVVVKPRDGSGGQGVVIGPDASPPQLAELRRLIQADPGAWIAQETVTLSTQPTVVDGELEERHVDLRPFVFFDGHDVVVPAGGLTRVALQQGERVVNSSRDGGGKATWIE